MSTRFLEAYLAAFGAGVTVAFGALILLAITGTMTARWFAAVRPLAEAVAGTLPLYILLFVPIALGVKTLYPFAGASHAQGFDLTPSVTRALEAQRLWMNPTFFVARGFAYLALATLLSEVLRRATPSIRRRIAAGSLPPLAFVLTFAGFDWFMARSAGFASDMYGLYIFGGAFSGCLGLLCLLGGTLHGALPEGFSDDLRHALGRLLFVGVLLWAYLGFCQFVLVWMADLPHEIPFYADRVHGFWKFVSIVLGFGHFAIPFLLLLSKSWKKRRAFLAAVGGWILVMHALDHEWLTVAPTRQPSILDAIPFAVVAILALLVIRLRLVPPSVDEPQIALALRYEAK